MRYLIGLCYTCNALPKIKSNIGKQQAFGCNYFYFEGWGECVDTTLAVTSYGDTFKRKKSILFKFSIFQALK